MPADANWKMMASVSMLGGIGFTVSLFIANLSFGAAEQADILNHAKLGIVVGSLFCSFERMVRRVSFSSSSFRKLEIASRIATIYLPGFGVSDHACGSRRHWRHHRYRHMLFRAYRIYAFGLCACPSRGAGVPSTIVTGLMSRRNIPAFAKAKSGIIRFGAYRIYAFGLCACPSRGAGVGAGHAYPKQGVLSYDRCRYLVPFPEFGCASDHSRGRCGILHGVPLPIK